MALLKPEEGRSINQHFNQTTQKYFKVLHFCIRCYKVIGVVSTENVM